MMMLEKGLSSGDNENPTMILVKLREEGIVRLCGSWISWFSSLPGSTRTTVSIRQGREDDNKESQWSISQKVRGCKPLLGDDYET